MQTEEEKEKAAAMTLSLNAELAEKKHASESMKEQVRALSERVAESAARFEVSEGIEKDLREEIRSLVVQVESGRSEKEREVMGRAAAEALVETLKGKVAEKEERMEDLVCCVEAKTGEVDAMEVEMKGWREKVGDCRAAMERSRESRLQ